MPHILRQDSSCRLNKIWGPIADNGGVAVLTPFLDMQRCLGRGSAQRQQDKAQMIVWSLWAMQHCTVCTIRTAHHVTEVCHMNFLMVTRGVILNQHQIQTHTGLHSLLPFPMPGIPTLSTHPFCAHGLLEFLVKLKTNHENVGFLVQLPKIYISNPLWCLMKGKTSMVEEILYFIPF